MASIIELFAHRAPTPRPAPPSDILHGFSLEVTPRAAASVARFDALLPEGTRVYVAHIDGAPMDAMVATARRLRDEGMAAMPHIPARSIPDAATLRAMVRRYREEAGVDQALLIGGSARTPAGAFAGVADMVATGAFDDGVFSRLHVAGHPEGNPDIDPDGGERAALAALRWKQDMDARTGATIAIATQFCFEAAPVVAWARRLAAAGVRLPIHVGVAGPAKLQTLIRYAMTCGVGPSLRVLRRRAADLSNLVLPFTPDAVLADLAAHRAADPDTRIVGAHFFPFGGVARTAEYAAGLSGGAVASRPRRA